MLETGKWSETGHEAADAFVVTKLWEMSLFSKEWFGGVKKITHIIEDVTCCVNTGCMAYNGCKWADVKGWRRVSGA